MFEKIDATTKRLEMTSLLVDLIKKSPAEDVRKVVYLLQGKLYPDYEGVELGLAEKLLIKSVAVVTGRTEKVVEGDYKKTGDLGSTVQNLIQKKSQMTLSKRSLTVSTVYNTFEKVAHASGTGSVETKIRLLTSLLNDASPLEAKYIARMAVGKLRLGVADMTVLEALAVAYGGDKSAREPLERAYNLCSDLGSVAEVAAEEGLEGIRRFRITVGRPIRPMLCERLPDAGSILEKMDGVGAAEYKYDGLRVQAHLGGVAKVHLFSRRLENITSQFPDMVQNLRKSIDASEAILDGECVAVDQNTGEMLPFQVISQRRGRKYELTRVQEEIPVMAFLFDLLYLNGRDLTLLPYPKRRKQLLEIVKPSEHVSLANQAIVKDPEKLDRFMEEAVASGCEGLVVKNVSEQSLYQAGARGWLWIKYKRSYKSELQDTFDLVPVGAFAGRGRRAGTYGALLMAVYNEKQDAFETICKLGSGFTDEDLANLPNTLDPCRTTHRNPRVKSFMEADVWFTPSLVLEVAADEITLSPLHTCARGAIRHESGLALRFPRFTGKWRKDKSAEDATTSEEALEMYKKQLKQIEAEA